MNGQQLKNIVAKGQLKPNHLVRRGSEGPWVPAGRIKGLFPGASAGSSAPQSKRQPQKTSKPLPKAAKAAPLHTAAAAPTPPAADAPRENAPAGRNNHAELNIDSFDIDSVPVSVSRRKPKGAMKGMKKSEQKKLTTILLSVIGGGTVFGLVVFIWAFSTGKFSSKKPEVKDPTLLALASDSGTAAKPSAEPASKPEEVKRWKRASIETTTVGDVEVMVLKPKRGAPPEGVKTDAADVLTVPVNLNLKSGAKKTSVELTSWADASLKSKVSLKDDQGNSYKLLDQIIRPGDDGKAITTNRIQVWLIFEIPSGARPKSLQIELPGAAFHADNATIRYRVDQSDIPAAPPPEPKATAPNPTAPNASAPSATAPNAAPPPKGDNAGAKDGQGN